MKLNTKASLKRMAFKPISISEATRRVVSKIKNEESISFFVEAGISKHKPSLLPDWREFSNGLLMSLTDRLCSGRFLSPKEGTMVKMELLKYKSHHGLQLLPEVVIQLIHPYIPKALQKMLGVFTLGYPNSNHWTLALLSGCKNTWIGTCNFDSHVEVALESAEIPYTNYAGSRRTGSSHSFNEYVYSQKSAANRTVKILKIHGCVRTPSTIRATIRQVSRQMPVSARDALHHLVQRRFLVIAGYRGGDFDIFPELVSAAADANGVLWLAKDKSSLTPEVRRMPNTTIATGDLNHFFKDVAQALGLKFRVYNGEGESFRDYLEKAVNNTRSIPTAIALSNLAMHIGCAAVVDLLCKRIISTIPSKAIQVSEAYMCLGDIKRRSHPKEALEYFVKAYLLLRPIRSKHPLLYAQCLKYLVGQHYLFNRLGRTLALNTDSLRWADKANDHSLVGRVFDDRALIFRRCGNVRHAVRLRLKSISALKKAGDLINLAMVYNNLGKDYDFLDQFDQAEKWWRLSLELKEKYTTNSPDIARTHFNLGELLRHTGRINEAIRHLVKARHRANIFHDPVVAARALYSLAAISIYQRKKAQGVRLVSLAKLKAEQAEDWHQVKARVQWATKIERMVRKGVYVRTI